MASILPYGILHSSISLGWPQVSIQEVLILQDPLCTTSVLHEGGSMSPSMAEEAANCADQAWANLDGGSTAPGVSMIQLNVPRSHRSGWRDRFLRLFQSRSTAADVCRYLRTQSWLQTPNCCSSLPAFFPNGIRWIKICGCCLEGLTRLPMLVRDCSETQS